jgi:hypothetical protein
MHQAHLPSAFCLLLLSFPPLVLPKMKSSHILQFLFLSSTVSASFHPPHCSHDTAESALLSTGSCCGALSYFLPDKTSYPNGTIYNASLTSYWSLQEGQTRPSCIVSPTVTEDVSLAFFLLVTGNKTYPG